MFKKAVKQNLRLRMALCGPAGAGKTYSALAVATAMGGKIAVIDTEHGSASKYADIFAFDVVEPDLFDPRELINTIRFAEKAGYSHIIIDSLSHYWSGKGGELDMVDAVAARSKSANTFTAWKTVTPVHNELIDTIIGSKINVIVTMRTKTEYVVETNAAGKQVPRKVGLAPVMRDGIEYEFDLCGDIDQEKNFVITKSRCPELADKVINRPGKQIADILTTWLNSGISAPEPEAAPEPAPEPEPEPEKKPYSKTIGPNNWHREMAKPIEPADVVPAEEAAPKAKPAPTSESAGNIAAEIKQVRDLAKRYGCKTAKDFSELMYIIIGKNISGATSLDSAERAKVIAFLQDAIREKESEAF